MTLSSQNNKWGISSIGDISWLKRKIGPIHIGAIICVILLAYLLFYFWYVVIPVSAIILIWKKTSLEKEKKKHATIAIVMIMVILILLMSYLNRPPVIEVTEPGLGDDIITVYEKTINIKGTVLPKKADLMVNNQKIETTNGNFSYSLSLSEGQNTVKITAKTWFEKETLLTVNRKLTEEEIVNKEEAKARAEAIAKEKAAKARAEREAWEQSRAGQLCKEHPTWTKEECQDIENKKIWIGMTKEQAIESWGRPYDVNKSVGSWGVHEQWVLRDSIYTPYLYFENGILTSWQN